MNEQLAYLETQVMTASPPKLRLMMIDTALQLARKSVQAMEVEQTEEAVHSSEQLRKIVMQLLTSLEAHDGGLGQDIQRVYMRLYRAVVDAQLSGHRQEMFEVVRVLEVERDTWQELEQRFIAESAHRNSRQSDCTDPAVTIGAEYSIGSSLSLEA